MDDHQQNSTTPTHPLHGLAATAYCSERGSSYHDRNREKVKQSSLARRLSIRREISKHLPNQKYQLLPWLEVGCGEGYNMYDGDVGVDIDPRPLKHLPPFKIPVIAASHTMPFPSESFPASFCVGLLMHQVDGEWQLTLEEMSRVTQYVICIGEYVAETEAPKLNQYWSDLLYQRPYIPPIGWKLAEVVPSLYPFDGDVTFLIFVRDDLEEAA